MSKKMLQDQGFAFQKFNMAIVKYKSYSKDGRRELVENSLRNHESCGYDVYSKSLSNYLAEQDDYSALVQAIINRNLELVFIDSIDFVDDDTMSMDDHIQLINVLTATQKLIFYVQKNPDKQAALIDYLSEEQRSKLYWILLHYQQEPETLDLLHSIRNRDIRFDFMLEQDMHTGEWCIKAGYEQNRRKFTENTFSRYVQNNSNHIDNSLRLQFFTNLDEYVNLANVLIK